MKKIIAISAAAMVATHVIAGVLAGNGFVVNANMSSNSMPVAVGTANVPAIPLTIANAPGVTGAGGERLDALLTFDGTNFYRTPVYWTNALSGYTNAGWVIPATNFTVYAALSISNGTATPITNLITSP